MTTTVPALAQDIGLARQTDYFLMKGQLTEDEPGLPIDTLVKASTRLWATRCDRLPSRGIARPDVVLVDIRPGEESGFEAARQLAGDRVAGGTDHDLHTPARITPT